MICLEHRRHTGLELLADPQVQAKRSLTQCHLHLGMALCDNGTDLLAALCLGKLQVPFLALVLLLRFLYIHLHPFLLFPLLFLIFSLHLILPLFLLLSFLEHHILLFSLLHLYLPLPLLLLSSSFSSSFFSPSSTSLYSFSSFSFTSASSSFSSFCVIVA